MLQVIRKTFADGCLDSTSAHTCHIPVCCVQAVYSRRAGEHDSALLDSCHYNVDGVTCLQAFQMVRGN